MKHTDTITHIQSRRYNTFNSDKAHTKNHTLTHTNIHTDIWQLTTTNTNYKRHTNTHNSQNTHTTQQQTHQKYNYVHKADFHTQTLIST